MYSTLRPLGRFSLRHSLKGIPPDARILENDSERRDRSGNGREGRGGGGGDSGRNLRTLSFKVLHLMAILLCLATVTIETNDFLHGNATDRGQLISAEICQMETFQTSCPEENQVLMVHEALLGRMHLGRCISEAFGYLNCSLSVLPEMDILCSGRRFCEVKVDDTSFKRTVPKCHKELKNHLKVIYSCIKVVFPSGSTKCQTIEADRGFISSQVTENTGCGLTGNPWVIEGDPGQRINVTLYDFSHEQEDLTGSNPIPLHPSASGASGVMVPRTCRVYATIRDSASTVRSLKVCEWQQRVTYAHTSTGNRIEIRIMSGKNPAKTGASSIQQAQNSPQFLLQFQVFGCADIKVSQDMQIDRLGDRMTISCHGSGRSWQLTCTENKWIGSYGNCDAEDITSTSGLHYATSTIILVVIAIVVSSLILVIGVICIKRKKREIDRVQTLQLNTDQYNLGNYSIGGTVSPDKLTPDSSNFVGTASFDGTGNEYARMRVMCLPQYDVKGPPPYEPDGRYGMPVVEHIYESPDCLNGRSPEGRRVYTTRIHQPLPPPREAECGGGRVEIMGASGCPPPQSANMMTQGRTSSCSQKHGCSSRTAGNYSL